MFTSIPPEFSPKGKRGCPKETTPALSILQIHVSFPVALSLTSMRAVIDRSNFFDVITVYGEK